MYNSFYYLQKSLRYLTLLLHSNSMKKRNLVKIRKVKLNFR